jgi:hypothetical protein
LAEQLSMIGEEREEYGAGDAGCRRVEKQGRRLKGAKRELAELIRSIEGPTPPRVRREHKAA